MSSWRTRKATLEDLPDLIQLHRELYVTYRDKILDTKLVRLIAYRDFDQILIEDIRQLLSGANTLVLVAEMNFTVVGYITGRVSIEAKRQLSKKGVIEDWYVQENAQAQGIGSGLLKEMQKYFAAEKCQVSEATTWMINRKARALYERDGWSEIQVLLRKEITR